MDRKSGKPVAIVTAAGRGIGAECARATAHRGHAVSLPSPSGAAQELAREPGGPDRLVTQTVETCGRLDALIHNAGHAPRSTTRSSRPESKTPNGWQALA